MSLSAHAESTLDAAASGKHQVAPTTRVEQTAVVSALGLELGLETELSPIDVYQPSSNLPLHCDFLRDPYLQPTLLETFGGWPQLQWAPTPPPAPRSLPVELPDEDGSIVCNSVVEDLSDLATHPAASTCRYYNRPKC